MTQLRCFSIPGMKLWFWSNDHEPPHFHAKRSGQWEYKVSFLESEAGMFDLVWSKTQKATISRQDKRALTDMVTTHRQALYQEWENNHA